MIIIRTIDDIKKYNYTDDNVVSGIESLENSSITFRGEGNVLLADKVKLKNSRIIFNGSNSLVYLSNSHRIYYLTISAWYNNTVYIGKNCSFNGIVALSLSEEQSIFIGDTCMFSSGITFDTADPHLIYNTQTYQRVNPSKSIFLGDHIWIGRNVSLLKGAKVHSGSIIALNSVVTGSKIIPSNVSIGGSSAKIIGRDVFWLPNCVHSYTTEKTEHFQKYTKDHFIYNRINDLSFRLNFDEIENKLFHASIQDRLDFLGYISGINNKERFSAI